ncbi:methionine ABC transporter permease [uncultured Cloacibacillus sp.]|uniref:methionine ABC transporter permease n=1 Tax=uncultured Cloacibacillus sp. TaxID=889794 RepID=UPI0026DC70FE|nr:methionine ABC transporter permease [uncultured Cloacibacillus sp.]
MNDMNIKLFKMKIIPALTDTLYMVTISFAIAVFWGFIIALILVCCDEKGLYENKMLYKVVSTCNNILRSFPFTILIVAMIPITRSIVGTSIGRTAAIVPLVVALSPFIGRLLENSLKEVDHCVIEAATSFCANKRQVICRVMLKEAVPSITLNLTLALINTISLSAMAGMVGGGGLGAIAIIYGYQSFNDFVMYSIVVILIVLVQVVQWAGTGLYKKTL